jgi:predicted transposase/invertase (TIGR01784 family)
MDKTVENQKLLEVTQDFLFKKIFGSKSRRRVLACLLNSILRDNPRIESLEIDNSEIPRDVIDDKDVRLDIRARTPDGTTVLVEVQCENDGKIIERSIFYQARVMSDILKQGESYRSIPDIISIWITDYSETRRKYHSHEIVNMYKETDGGDPIEIATNKFRTFIIELPKINYGDMSQRRRDMFLSWMTFLKHPEMITKDIINDIPEIGEAMAELKRISADRDTREVYEVRRRAVNDRNSSITEATERGRLEGIFEGRLEGRHEGILEGMGMGMEKGILEGMGMGMEKKAMDIALMMLGKGADLRFIAECTGLSEEDIANLVD